ncbi:ATP-binding protein [Adlercreutzia sp. R21]|uniref:histidine kinase n=1 Tax=Adlercreutzia wanghongyangiae TaxID=3111451 RepID=A0ABU6II66_9ACTN|nr:ATP-binding protein [Adlercreutzia sp. R21]MEC4176153.1 ATP-binding protein [Adlercreutzia sp. R7]MEC4184005.1 ATP-binding protein [Adlercreutzia sp. R21]
MDEMLRVWATTFDRSPLPFGVAEVLLDDEGRPYDAVYRYLNPAMASITDHAVEDLIGVGMYTIWGGDPAWLDHFYEAAYEGKSVEFETLSDMLRQFFRAEVFPVAEGLFALTLQDVTSWIVPAQRSLDKAAAGLFFFDMRYRQMLLTDSAREQSGVDTDYISLAEFIERTFGLTAGDDLRRQMENFLENQTSLYQEGQLADGRWLRISLDHTGRSERFAYGFLEDFTRTKQAEQRSEQYVEVIDSLGAENFALYLVDLETNELEVYRRGENDTAELALASAQEADYPSAMRRYIETYVVEEDRPRVLAEVGPDVLWKRLEDGEADFSVGYRRLFGDEEQYVELRIIRLPHPSSKVILAARNVTHEMREQLLQKLALQNALDLAEHASRAKSTFLTNMSHDFRTPMNSISGFAAIALDHLNDTDRVRDCLRKITLSSDHLLSLVNDILDVSRIESGRMSFNEDVVDLDEVAAEVATMFSDKAEACGIDLTVDAAGLTHTQVVTDPLRLNQVLVNTVGNALKFTPAGGLVTVSLAEREGAPRGFGSYAITVSDTGCGMTPEFLDRIFLPFERDGLGYANKTEGTGLGMTITKSLVDLMGGEIQVESVVGRGSTFTITLPLRLASPEEVSQEEARNAAMEECRRDFAGCKVLVVDDDDLSREILMEILKDYGFTVEEARDGDAAVRKVASVAPFHYDAVLMDMRMPRMDGDEATREIRALDRPDAASLPIIAETADAFEEGQRRAREAGMTALTTKPLNTHALIALLDKHIPQK